MERFLVLAVMAIVAGIVIWRANRNSSSSPDAPAALPPSDEPTADGDRRPQRPFGTPLTGQYIAMYRKGTRGVIEVEGMEAHSRDWISISLKETETYREGESGYLTVTALEDTAYLHIVLDRHQQQHVRSRFPLAAGEVIEFTESPYGYVSENPGLVGVIRWDEL